MSETCFECKANLRYMSNDPEQYWVELQTQGWRCTFHSTPPTPTKPHNTAANHLGWRLEFQEFLQKLEQKVEAGALAYGDRSFNLPADHLATELEAELIDICGWGFVLWVRMQRLRDSLANLEESSYAQK